jgi:hypothetical protein
MPFLRVRDRDPKGGDARIHRGFRFLLVPRGSVFAGNLLPQKYSPTRPLKTGAGTPSISKEHA